MIPTSSDACRERPASDRLTLDESHLTPRAFHLTGYQGGLQLEDIEEELGPVKSRVHRRLENSEDFRVLVLRPPSEQSSEIVCELQYVSFHEKPDYEALSYVWGYAFEPQAIVLDGQPFNVTTNLYSALWHLRRDSPRLLWIDALCIDQENPKEKNNQVQLMRRIYSCCHTGVVWLGPGEPSLELGWSTVAALKRADVELMRDEYKEQGGFLNYDKAGKFFSRDQWSALQALFLDGPWHRVWIMQELACAPRIVLMLGGKTMDWNIISDFLDHDQFPDAYHSAFGHARYEYNIDRTFCQIQLVHYQRELTQGASNGPSGILDVLSRFKSTGATDPRDKIYALIGLATSGPKFEIDYAKPVKETYVDVFAQYVNFTQNLDLLCQSPWGFREYYATYGEARRDEPDLLPSWCPDFNDPSNSRLLFAQRGVFCAGGPICATPCRITEFCKLQLPGVCLGELIEDESRTGYRDANLLRDGIRKAAFLDRPAAFELDDSERAYAPTAEPLSRAFSRTLVADCKAYPIARLQHADTLSWHSHLEAWYHHSDSEDRAYAPGHPASQMLRVMHEDWRFTISDRGFFCLVSAFAIAGDCLVVLNGAKVPMVIRSWMAEDGSCEYGVVGTAYVHGFMDGEAMKWVQDGTLAASEFVLI